MAGDVAQPTRFGPYELVRRLGEGGMGVVYEARDPKAGRLVALKVLNRDKQESSVSVQRFQREARSSAKLMHPHICAVYEAGEINGILYFTMELVKGQSLSDLIEKGGPLPWRKACALARDVADALAHAHGTGILHRDIKPSNIIIDELGHAKVVDFGLARDEDEISRLTRTGALLGTPAYMAPERLDRSLAAEAGAAADIYALGVTLYEALSGKTPFEADSLYESLKLVKEGNPPPLELPDGAPPGLATLVMKLIARNPMDRPATSGAVARALEDLAAGKRGQRGSRIAWIRKHPRAFLAICAAAPVLPVLAVVLGRDPRHPPPPPGPIVAPVPTTVAPVRPEGPVGFVARARERLYAGDFAAAAALYDRVLANAPEDETALCERALVAALLEDLEATLAARPRLQGHEKHPVGRLVLATGSYALGIKTDPGPIVAAERDHPLAPALLVLREYGCDDLKVSEKLLQDALVLRPDCGWIAARLAFLVSVNDRHEEALAIVDRPRTYEGLAEDMRQAYRALILEGLGRGDEADRCHAAVKGPPRFAARARGRRAVMALLKGDLAATIEAQAGHEPATIADRLNHAFALFFSGRPEEGRPVFDMAVELADEVGDQGAIAHAIGESKEVLDACRTLRRSRKNDAAMNEVAQRARGFRARFAARTGDHATARKDLERLKDNPAEAGAVDAVLKLNRGDYVGAVRAFVALSEGSESKVPRDAVFDFALAVELGGDETNAREAYVRLMDDVVFRRFAGKRLEELDGRKALPPDAVFISEGPSDDLMIGGPDGQGPRLYTGARWVPGQETVYGFAPTINIPQSAAGRVLEVDVGSETPVEVHIVRGAPHRDEHAWWTQGFPIVQRFPAAPNPRVSWTAEAGTWTIHVARVLPRDAEQAPLKLDHVKVTLRGPAAK